MREREVKAIGNTEVAFELIQLGNEAISNNVDNSETYIYHCAVIFPLPLPTKRLN